MAADEYKCALIKSGADKRGFSQIGNVQLFVSYLRPSALIGGQFSVVS